MSVSIIIPTLNGLELLQKHLPTLLDADGVGQAEVIVVDDGGTDETASWLAASAPQVRVIRLETNSGFSRACNAGIQAAQGDAIVLLNNDVHVTPGFLAPLLRPLEADPEVFAVNASILIPGKDMLDEGQKHGAFHHGLFYVDCLHNPALRAAQTAPTLYATACAAAYRRAMLDALGGFDDLFSPAYWEDVDLSYRALKRGWRVLYEPLSVVCHEHESTTARLDPRFVSMLRQRNHFFFVWKNIGDARWLWANVLLAPWVGVYHALRGGDTSLLRGLGAALRNISRVRARRREEQAAARVSDREVLAGAALGAGQETLTPQPPLPQAGEGEPEWPPRPNNGEQERLTPNPRPLAGEGGIPMPGEGCPGGAQRRVRASEGEARGNRVRTDSATDERRDA